MLHSERRVLTPKVLQMARAHYNCPQTANQLAAGGSPFSCARLLTIHYSLLTTHYSLLTTHYSMLTTYCLPLTAYYLLRIAYCLPLTTYYVLLNSYYVLLTIDYCITYYLPLAM